MSSVQSSSIQALKQSRRRILTVGAPGGVKVIKVQVPGIQGPKGDPGKDGKDASEQVESISKEQIENLF